ncbi:hypothetical protein P3T27_006250 [Kitasatospora sp. MAA19]|uniref:hypothetical protein n=1 Tax=Kitasatospora sp. MAA19 TaxID=3035090 RepID=UPI002474D7F1|nr:hypothetical protein [Kitasatospora sp. MAA19]MDH6709502.1 hypothetical protein [Kitasatospora sp. MAA19]
MLVGGGVHEGDADTAVDQPAQVGEAVLGRDAVGLAEPVELGPVTGHQAQVEAGERGEDRQVRLLGDVTQTDDADGEWGIGAVELIGSPAVRVVIGRTHPIRTLALQGADRFAGT